MVLKLRFSLFTHLVKVTPLKHRLLWFAVHSQSLKRNSFHTEMLGDKTCV